MARCNDSSPDCQRWTNRKLLAEIRRYANLETFGSFFRNAPADFSTQSESGDFIRRETQVYRETWLLPLLDEIERRMLK